MGKRRREQPPGADSKCPNPKTKRNLQEDLNVTGDNGLDMTGLAQTGDADGKPTSQGQTAHGSAVTDAPGSTNGAREAAAPERRRAGERVPSPSPQEGRDTGSGGEGKSPEAAAPGAASQPAPPRWTNSVADETEGDQAAASTERHRSTGEELDADTPTRRGTADTGDGPERGSAPPARGEGAAGSEDAPPADTPGPGTGSCPPAEGPDPPRGEGDDHGERRGDANQSQELPHVSVVDTEEKESSAVSARAAGGEHREDLSGERARAAGTNGAVGSVAQPWCGPAGAASSSVEIPGVCAPSAGLKVEGGTAEPESVGTAGAAEPGSVGTAGAAEPGSLGTASTAEPESVGTAGAAEPESVGAASTAEPESVGAAGTTKPGSLGAAGTAEPESVGTASTTEPGSLGAAGTTELGSLGTASTAEPESLGTAGTTKPGSLGTAGTTELESLGTAGTTKPGSLGTAGTTELGSLGAAGTAEPESVGTAGTTELESVVATGTAEPGSWPQGENDSPWRTSGEANTGREAAGGGEAPAPGSSSTPAPAVPAVGEPCGGSEGPAEDPGRTVSPRTDTQPPAGPGTGSAVGTEPRGQAGGGREWLCPPPSPAGSSLELLLQQPLPDAARHHPAAPEPPAAAARGDTAATGPRQPWPRDDATDIVCGLILELSNLNRLAMSAHRGLEALRRPKLRRSRRPAPGPPPPRAPRWWKET